MTDRKQHVVDILKSFETGDTRALQMINPAKYIQHNLTVADGVGALAARIAAIPKGTATVNTVREFEDGDFVFTHSVYKVGGVERVAFDIFRFEGNQITEHWDNLQELATKPAHTMIDGPTTSTDPELTEANRALLKQYMEDVFFQGRKEKFPTYFAGNNYIQHNPLILDDGLSGLAAGLKALGERGITVRYDRVHMVLAEGNFVLVVNEGAFAGEPTAIYDLYRVQDGKIAEHWDTLQSIPPQTEWKNANGKF